MVENLGLPALMPIFRKKRSSISLLEALVKERSRIFSAGTPLSKRVQSRSVSTVVFPEPGPATTRAFSAPVSIACLCSRVNSMNSCLLLS